MKRALVISILVFSIIFSTVQGIAETQDSFGAGLTQSGENETRLTYFSNISHHFRVSGNTAYWTLNATKTKQYDKAYVTAMLYKNSGPIASVTSVFYNTNINTSRSRTLDAHGTYYVKFTIKCYKDGVLKETITLNSASGTY